MATNGPVVMVTHIHYAIQFSNQTRVRETYYHLFSSYSVTLEWHVSKEQVLITVLCVSMTAVYLM